MRRLTIGLLVAALMSWNVGAVVTQEAFPEVRAALDAGDYGRARELLETLHAQGDAQATFYLSLLYRKGLGVPVDLVHARHLLEQAATAGDPRAQYNLGNERFRDGSDQGAVEAAALWRKAAEQGLVEAQHNLGSLYALGRGVKRDLQQARYWYEMASRNGSTRSARALVTLGLDGGMEGPGAMPQTMRPESGTNDTGSSPPAPDAMTGTAEVSPEPVPGPEPEPAPAAMSGTGEMVQTQSQDDIPPALPSWVAEPPEAPPLPEPQPLPAPEPAPEITQDASGPIAVDAAWLETRGEDGFTLQLFASRDLDTLWKMAAAHDWERPLLRYRVAGPGGEPLWALGYGLFTDREVARAAGEELPESVRRNGPWPRSLASIREQLVE